MQEARALIKNKSHRWSRRNGESLKIGDAIVTFKLTGRGKGRRVVAVVDAPENIDVTAIELSHNATQNTTT